ncbi:hypothetical protein VTO42DRAFT_4794 [Malbranchea cinnamomea]
MTGPPQDQQHQSPSKSSSEIYNRSISNSPSSSTHQQPLRTSVPELPPISNVFSDEFSLEPLSGQASPVSSVSSDHASLSSRSLATNDGRPPHISPFGDSSEILPQEEMLPPPPEPERDKNVPTETAAVGRAPSSTPSMSESTPTAHRSMSTSSRISVPRAMSPYTGQTGPSHPYAMYPQGTTVARTSSVSSSSTVRPIERPQVSAPPPQHPYMLYSQNTVPEEVLSEPTPNPSIIPLGFPGRDHVFQHTPGNGPDEVGDIVGPDGHTEQLPPYSRYPESLPPKQGFGDDLGVPTTGVPGAPDGVPISQESGVSAQTLLVNQANAAAGINASATTQNQTTVADDAGGGFKEKLAEKGKKKLCCGVPIWMFLLVAVVLVLGGVIGGVIGGLLGSQKGRSDATREMETGSNDRPMITVTATPSPILDAIPINLDQLSGELLPLPTGNDFVFPANTITGQSNSCINDTKFSNAWQCVSTGLWRFGIQSSDNMTTIALRNYQTDGSMLYGAQRPILQYTNFSLQLARDATMMSLGPALFFFTPFDKLVLIPEKDFPIISSRGAVYESDILRRSSPPIQDAIAKAGDRPWFCWWNTTLLEGFIYLNQTTSSSVSLNTTGTTTEAPSRTSKAVPETTPSTTSAPLPREAQSSFYLRPVRFEEKRFARRDTPPYCEQRQILDNGHISPPLATAIVIEELDTAEGPGITGPYPGLGYAKRADKGNVCYCQWLYS